MVAQSQRDTNDIVHFEPWKMEIHVSQRYAARHNMMMNVLYVSQIELRGCSISLCCGEFDVSNPRLWRIDGAIFFLFRPFKVFRLCIYNESGILQ